MVDRTENRVDLLTIANLVKRYRTIGMKKITPVVWQTWHSDTHFVIGPDGDYWIVETRYCAITVAAIIWYRYRVPTMEQLLDPKLTRPRKKRPLRRLILTLSIVRRQTQRQLTELLRRLLRLFGC